MARCSNSHSVVGSLSLVFVLFDCLWVLSHAFQRTSGAWFCTTLLTEIQAGEASALCEVLTYAPYVSPMDIDLISAFFIFPFCRLLYR